MARAADLTAVVAAHHGLAGRLSWACAAPQAQCPHAHRLMPGVSLGSTGADIADLGEEHGHRVLRVCGKGTKVVLVPLPPAVGRAIDRATGTRTGGPILVNSRGTRMDRHAATRRLRRLAQTAGVRITRPHPQPPPRRW